MLVNIGYSIYEIIEIISSNNALSETYIEQYIAKLNRQIFIKRAAVDNLLAYRSNQFEKDEIVELCPSVYYFSPDGCEQSHHNIITNDINNELIRTLPISGFAGIFSDYLNQGSKGAQWGRSIALKHANLLQIDTSQMIKLGGRHSIAFTTVSSDDNNYQSDERQIDLIRDYLKRHKLEPDGITFSPYTLTNGTTKLISTYYMPVKPAE